MKALSLSPYLQHLDQDAAERLTRSLERTERGVNVDYVTPLVPNREYPTEGRLQRINEFNTIVLPTGYDWLDAVEEQQREKIGPYSIMVPYKDRKEEVYSYFQSRETAINVDALEYAASRVAGLVHSRLHPVDIERAYNDMPRGTNLGLPFATADGEYRRLVLELSRHVMRTRFGSEPDPCILYWRGQPKGLDKLPKQRTVWGFPHYITLFELMLQIPLLHYLRKNPSFSAWVGPWAVDVAVTDVLDSTDHDILSVDFSGFDASIPRSLLQVVFDIVRSWFRSSDKHLIDYVEWSFLNIGLVTPEGILVDRDGGVPSGSGLTNLVDSLVQMVAFHYIAYRMHNTVVRHIVQGDDGVVVFQRPWNVDDVVDIARELNLDISGSKGGVSKTTVYYLQNVHSKEYRPEGRVCPGVRPLFRFLNGALSFERFRDHWKAADNTLRWWQQLENCRHHPRFKEAVQFLYDEDPYSREYTASQLIRLAGGLEKAESALGQSSFPYGKTPVSKLGMSAVARELETIRRRKTGGGDGGASGFLL